MRVREEHGGEAILPYSYMGTQGMIQGNIMSARVMNALGATELERTICATAGMRRDGAWPTACHRRSIPRSGRTLATC